MIYLLVAVTMLHVTFFIWLTIKWLKLPIHNQSDDIDESELPLVSVLVPIRNERETITTLLQSIARQNYPRKRLEVVIIDDHSEDDTIKVIEQEMQSISFPIRISELRGSHEGKKEAATLGVENARGEIVLCTDADCEVGPNWVMSFVQLFRSGKYQMITGPVSMCFDSLIQKIQAIEFNGLISYGAVTLSIGRPGMCNAANMAYLKAAFQKVNGYKGNDDIPSGDDEFLLQKIHQLGDSVVTFNKSPEAIVQTSPKPNLIELINQRIRWSSKWKKHDGAFLKTYAVISFVNFILFFWMGAMLFTHPEYRLLLVSLFVIRWVIEYYFMRFTSRFFVVSVYPWETMIISLAYPIYVIFLGFASIFGRYSWKGRSYKS